MPPQSVYRVTTDKGTFDVTVGDQAADVPLPARSPIQTAAGEQLARTDLPPSVRAELEAVQAGTAQPGKILGNARAMATPSNLATLAAVGASAATAGLAAVPAMAAVGLSAAGGAGLGSIAQQLDTGRPQSIGEVATSMGSQGVVNALGEGAGRAIAAGATKVSTYLMNRAANVTDRLAREFPDLSQTLIDNAITVSQGGYQRARALLATAKNVANAALQNAETNGARIPLQLTPEIADSLKTVIIDNAMKTGQAASTGGAPGVMVATERLSPKTRMVLNTIDAAVEHGEVFQALPTEADLLKSQLQREAKNAVYAARLNPNGAPAIAQSAALKADYATELNSAIDAVANGYKSANARAQEMIGATRAVRQAVRPGKNLYMATVRPTAGAVLGSIVGETKGHPGYGAAIGAGLATPGMMSREAIALAHPAVQELLKQLPKGLVNAIMATIARSQSVADTPASGQP